MTEPKTQTEQTKRRFVIEIEVDETHGKFIDCGGCLELVFNSTPNTQDVKPITVLNVTPAMDYSQSDGERYRTALKQMGRFVDDAILFVDGPLSASDKAFVLTTLRMAKVVASEALEGK